MHVSLSPNNTPPAVTPVKPQTPAGFHLFAGSHCDKDAGSDGQVREGAGKREADSFIDESRLVRGWGAHGAKC